MEGFHMEVTDALKRRYTVRAFKPDPVDRNTLEKIMEAALKAPSWANTQPWEIYIAGGEVLNRLREAYVAKLRNCIPRQPDLAAPKEWPPALRGRMEKLRAERMTTLERVCLDKSKLKDIAEMNYHFFYAPTVAYLCMDRTLTPWSVFDLGLLAQSIMLAAQHFGIDSATAVNFVAHPDLLRQELMIPDELSIIIGIALGHADMAHPQNQYRSPRRSIQEAISFRGI
jgi:nitroreductase